MITAVVTAKNARSGCYGDPPNYPTYFYGVETDLRRKPWNRGSMSISYAASDEVTYLPPLVKKRCVELLAEWEKNKLPESHPRVQAWEQATYAHMAHCYNDASQLVVPFEYGKPGTIIYPITEFWRTHYGLRVFQDDPRFSEEWRTAELESIRLNNEKIMELIRAVCVPENHRAVQFIRRYYPEHQPRLDWIEKTPENPGDWWDTGDKPSPENCPGVRGIGKHPVNSSWCQRCGWREQGV